MKIEVMATELQGGALAPWSYESAPLGPFDCIVKVQYCGICHSDIHMIDNDWGMSRYPLVPGHEVVGEVVECGPAVFHLRAGDRVGIGWQRSADLTCPDCLHGDDNLCDNTTGVISHGYGGFGSALVMDSRFCFPLPAGLASNTAGPLLCGGATVYSALRNAGMTSGQKIGIVGVGGLGHMAVQFAARLGNEVTIFTSSHDKAEEVAKLGARNAIVTPAGERPRTKERFDIILNTAPAELEWNAFLKLLAGNGTLSFVGLPGEPAGIDLNLLLAKQRKVTASVIGSRGRITEMLQIADRFGIAPIVEEFPVAEVNRALQKVRDNTIRYRAVLKA